MNIETIQYRGKTIEIDTDEDADSPREWGNAGTMVCWHRRYNLGDKHEFENPEDFMEWWKDNGEGGVLLPLYLFDHSGLSISTGAFSCPWDSGRVGYIYCTAGTIEDEWGKDPNRRVGDKSKTAIERATDCLQAEVRVYDEFLKGEVYCYAVGEDSCSGFYGLEHCIEEAKASADNQIEKEEQKRQAKLKVLIKGHTPIDIRERILTGK